jgi:hypothetical protein
VRSHRGDFHDPFADSEVRAKYRALAGEVLTGEGVAAVERSVDRFEDWTTTSEFLDLLRRHTRAR